MSIKLSRMAVAHLGVGLGLKRRLMGRLDFDNYLSRNHFVHLNLERSFQPQTLNCIGSGLTCAK